MFHQTAEPVSGLSLSWSCAATGPTSAARPLGLTVVAPLH
jgi:hypothetical protein